MSKLTSFKEIFIIIKNLREIIKGFMSLVLGKVLGEGDKVVDVYI